MTQEIERFGKTLKNKQPNPITKLNEMYGSEEEYNEAMSGQAEAEMMAELAAEIYKQVESLEQEKQDIQNKIDELLSQLP